MPLELEWSQWRSGCGSPDRQMASSSYDVIIKMAEEPQEKKPRVQSENYKDRFLAVFPELVDCVTKDGLNSSEIAVAMQHFKSVSQFASFEFSLGLMLVLLLQCLEYTVPGGKLNRGLMVIGSLKHLQGDTEPEVEKIALVLGWCVELVSSMFRIIYARVCKQLV